MELTLENIYYVSQIGASIAVFASVIFLAYQIRENTTVIRANASKDAEVGWAEVNFRLASLEERGAFARSFDPEVQLADFSDDEKVVLFFFGRSLLQRFESEYFQFSGGLLNAEKWHAHRRWCASWLKHPVWQEFWANERLQILYTQSFLDDLAAAELEAVPATAGGLVRAGEQA